MTPSAQRAGFTGEQSREFDRTSLSIPTSFMLTVIHSEMQQVRCFLSQLFWSSNANMDATKPYTDRVAQYSNSPAIWLLLVLLLFATWWWPLPSSTKRSFGEPP